MWKGKTVSVVISSYRERNSIREVIDGYFATGVVDEVIAVDNNAEAGSNGEIQQTRARLITEERQGQGFGLRAGMREAKGQYVILSEGDGTYDPYDISKFLAYGEDFPVVLGTRTNTSLIGPDSGMFLLRRIADELEGRLIEMLFFTNRLTDIGCTYKLLRREVVERLDTKWQTGDSHFITEVTLQVAARKILFVEIPVAFKKRIGVSSVTENFFNITKWGVKLLVFILSFWVRWISGGIR
ncbi:MAG: Glycosyl transferase, family 2 [Parcubacteria group bacterium GW2011_GWA2_49_9]|nr:MAG: Glycosyl transferase, family 2 [Parcubacteria group bacterium GW2011_GWA2_49_9]